MEYMGTKEASEKWGYSQSTIQKWCREGKIFLVLKAEKSKYNGQWQIPIDAECPRQIKNPKEC